LSKKDIILAERAFFVDTLKGLKKNQWQADTLCAGWTVEDLAAHLIVRERGSIPARAGIVMPFLHHKHDVAIAEMKQIGHKKLINKLEHPPAWIKRLPFNVIEFYVHNEDLLRGKLGRSRVISDELEEALSGFVLQLARLAFRRVTGSFRLVIHDESSSETHERQIGKQNTSSPELEISGRAGELILLFMGRGKHAKVRAAGSDEAKRLYRLADVGI
jgi:uncharacterized protein (TIGR03085 family)